jgi:protein phosphatase
MLRVAEHFERTDTGRQRRANEDSYFARAPLFAVADGMGGAQAGEVASGLAVEVLEQGLPDGGGTVEERLARRVAEANARINELSRSSEDRAGMGTTLTAAYVGEHELTVVHVGDSRLYRQRDDDFERLTDDHSLVEELVRQGKLTPQEADEHPQRSIITRALGPEAGVDADSRTFPARDGDVYLLCSDGLTSMVPEARVAELVRAAPSLADAGRALVDAANAAGGRDNITVVLFRLEEVVQAGADLAGGGALPEQATTSGAAAPHTDDVRRAVAGADAAALADAPAAGVERRVPQRPRSPQGPPPRRRRRLRIPAGLVVATVIVAGLVAAFWFASQTVYFVGSSRDGFVTVYRGLPYDLPAGVTLYHVNYQSSVPTATLPPRQKTAVVDHKLRSRDDAQDLVRRLETGQVRAS